MNGFKVVGIIGHPDPVANNINKWINYSNYSN